MFSSKNEWKLSKIQTEIICVNPESVTTQLCCFIICRIQESPVFLRNIFPLKYIPFSPFPPAAPWHQGEKKKALPFFLRHSGFRTCPCAVFRVYHWHLLTELKTTALARGNCFSSASILMVIPKFGASSRSATLNPDPQSDIRTFFPRKPSRNSTGRIIQALLPSSLCSSLYIWTLFSRPLGLQIALDELCSRQGCNFMPGTAWKSTFYEILSQGCTGKTGTSKIYLGWYQQVKDLIQF